MGRPEQHDKCSALRGERNIQTVYVRRGSAWQAFGWMCLACHQFWPQSLDIEAPDPPQAWRRWRESQLTPEQKREDERETARVLAEIRRP